MTTSSADNSSSGSPQLRVGDGCRARTGVKPAEHRTIVLVTKGGDWWETVQHLSAWADLDN